MITNRGQCSLVQERQKTRRECLGRCCESAFCHSHVVWRVRWVAVVVARQRRCLLCSTQYSAWHCKATQTHFVLYCSWQSRGTKEECQTRWFKGYRIYSWSAMAA